MTTKQVEENIKRIEGNKATGLDGFGMKIITLALSAISQSLANIYNTSIYEAVCPLTNFKKARPTPVYKKNSPHDKKNYRPISVQPIMSKPLERHLASSYLEYLTNNGLLYSKQSAYRPTTLVKHPC